MIPISNLNFLVLPSSSGFVPFETYGTYKIETKRPLPPIAGDTMKEFRESLDTTSKLSIWLETFKIVTR